MAIGSVASVPSVRAASDERLEFRQLLSELRVAHRECPGTPGRRKASPRIRVLESQILDRRRRRTAPRERVPADATDATGCAVVEYRSERGRIIARVSRADGVTEHALCGTARAQHLARTAGAGLRRLAFSEGRPHVAAAARKGLHRTGVELDRALMRPLDLDEHRVVVVPTGAIATIPWAIVPSLAERTVTISPSPPGARRRRMPATPRVLLVAGPGLDHAVDELEHISRLQPGSVLPRGDEATCDAVLAAMGRADLVHIAAHGVFREDRPAFSSVALADGPLTVCDLEQLDHVPSVVVLSACEAGRNLFGPRRAQGPAASLLAQGVGTVIGPVSIIPDDGVCPMMVDLHVALRDHRDPAVALARAAARARARCGPGDLASAGSFIALS